MIERLGEAIRKYEVIIGLESNAQKKEFMTTVLNHLKSEYNKIVENNIPCPPELVDGVDKALTNIETWYAKIAAN